MQELVFPDVKPLVVNIREMHDTAHVLIPEYLTTRRDSEVSEELEERVASRLGLSREALREAADGEYEVLMESFKEKGKAGLMFVLKVLDSIINAVINFFNRKSLETTPEMRVLDVLSRKRFSKNDITLDLTKLTDEEVAHLSTNGSLTEQSINRVYANLKHLGAALADILSSIASTTSKIENRDAKEIVDALGRDTFRYLTHYGDDNKVTMPVSDAVYADFGRGQDILTGHPFYRFTANTPNKKSSNFYTMSWSAFSVMVGTAYDYSKNPAYASGLASIKTLKGTVGALNKADFNEGVINKVEIINNHLSTVSRLFTDLIGLNTVMNQALVATFPKGI